REQLRLAEGSSEGGAGSFVRQSQVFCERLESVIGHATGRENQLFNDAMADVVAYVQQATGRDHDDDLSAIIRLMGDGEFNCERRRRRHKWSRRGNDGTAP